MSTHSTSGGRPGLELPIDTVRREIFGFSAVSMRCGASTCIRSRPMPPYHNRYSRKPEPEGAARDQTTTGSLPTINLPGLPPPHRLSGKLR